MILTRFHIGLAAAVVTLVAITFFWQSRQNEELRVRIEEQKTVSAALLSVLQQQVGTQAQRVAAAEANVSALLEAAQTTSAALGRTPIPTAIDSEQAFQATAKRADELIKQQKQQEALDEYVRCYRELRALRSGSVECQRLMTAIKTLGRTFPPAMSALAGLRDTALRQRQAEPGRQELVFEIALLNDRLGEGHRTIELYDSLPADNRRRPSLAMIANAAFIEARRYADALIGKGVGQRMGGVESGTKALPTLDASLQGRFRQAIIDQTLPHIEVLTGTGKLEEARMLTEQLLAFDGTETTRAAIKRHVDRATR